MVIKHDSIATGVVLMPRAAREKSSTGIYHVMLRGVNRRALFEDDEDNEKFLQIVSDCKKVSEFEFYGYCLMGNHVHMLIKVGKEEIEQVMKRIGSRYAYWFNWKYKRSGHVFQDRFKSEPVKDDGYFIIVLRYIHQNPIKAGICATLDGYKWSSYNEYIKKSGIIDAEFAMTIIGEDTYEEYMKSEADDVCLELEKKNNRKTDKEVASEIEKRLKIKAIMIQNEPRERKKQLLKKALTIEGVSTRQLARVTGVSVNIIWNL